MLSIQTISRAAAKGYAEYIAEQEEEAAQIMAEDPNVSAEEARHRAARVVVERVARRDGEDVAEALRQFDRRHDLEQMGAQASYYKVDDSVELSGPRLTHLVGDKAGQPVTDDELKDMLLVRDAAGRRMDDPRHAQLTQLFKEVGMQGTPTLEQRAALRQGQHPATGQPLTGRAAMLQKRMYAATAGRSYEVTGIDLTLSAPKSVSIYAAAAAASGDMNKYEAVLAAQRAAAEATIRHIEKKLVSARRGKGGAERIAANLTAGVVKLETGSRANDPQLHSHVVLSTTVESADGKRSKLDGQPIFNSSKYIGTWYRRELAHQLGEKLGLQMKADEVGTHELVGFDEKLIEKYSTRRGEIAETLSEMDHADARIRNAVGADKPAHVQAWKRREELLAGVNPVEREKAQAYAKFLKLPKQGGGVLRQTVNADKQAHKTAHAKVEAALKSLTKVEKQKAETFSQSQSLSEGHDAPRRQTAVLKSRRGKEASEADLLRQWQLDPALSASVVERAEQLSKTYSTGPVSEEQLFNFVATNLTEVDGQQTFSEKDARTALAAHAPTHWSDQRVAEATTRFLSSPDHIVNVQTEVQPEQKRAGWTTDVKRFTTPQVVALQEQIKQKAVAVARLDQRVEIDFALLAGLSESYTLTEQQDEVTAAVAATNMAVILGRAGTGKSHVLKPTTEALQAAGYEVSTFGVKKEQAYRLANEIGAQRGESLAKLLMRHDDDPTIPYPGLLEGGYWAQGEDDSIRAERRALQRTARETQNRARQAERAGDEKGRHKAQVEAEKADKKLDAFTRRRAADPSKDELAQAWDRHLEQLAMAKRLPHGAERRVTMERLAQERERLVEAKAYAADAQERIDWDTPQCWIIDEAALLTDQDLSRLLEVSRERNVKLVFLGDREQGRAIGVSGAYAQLEEQYGSVELTEIQRAKAAWERDMQARFHDLPREPEMAEEQAKQLVGEYEAHDRIDYITGANVADAVTKGEADADNPMVARDLGVAAVADWYMQHEEKGEEACVQTRTRSEQAKVAEAIQERLLDAGKLDSKAKTVELPLDANVCVNGRVGEPIMIRHNISSKDLRNGMLGKITAIRRDGSIQVEVQDGDRMIRRSLTAKALKSDHAVALSYSSTISKEQGETHDYSAVLVQADGSPMEKGDLYAGLTRGKYENRAIVATNETIGHARDHLAKAMKNRKADEALTLDWVNSPLTREEIDREKSYGIFGAQIDRNIREQRRIDFQRDQQKRAKLAEQRRVRQARANRRLAEEKAQRAAKQTKRRRHGMSMTA